MYLAPFIVDSHALILIVAGPFAEAREFCEIRYMPELGSADEKATVHFEYVQSQAGEDPIRLKSSPNATKTPSRNDGTGHLTSVKTRKRR